MANQYAPLVADAANAYGLPPALLHGLIQEESGFNPAAVSPKGAVGLGQFLPATAKEVGIDPTDPKQSIYGAAYYLAKQIQDFGDIDKGVAAYNAGPTQVSAAIAAGQNWIDHLPSETHEYMGRVTANAEDYMKAQASPEKIAAPAVATTAPPAMPKPVEAGVLDGVTDLAGKAWDYFTKPDNTVDATTGAPPKPVEASANGNPDVDAMTGVNPLQAQVQAHPIAAAVQNVQLGGRQLFAQAAATYAPMLGLDSVAKNAAAYSKSVDQYVALAGPDSILDKTERIVGAIAPALVAPEARAAQWVVNGGLFAAPAFKETLDAYLTKGRTFSDAFEHAATAAGVNLLLPTVATHGSEAATEMLGLAVKKASGQVIPAMGLRGAATELGRAAGEGAAFAVAPPLLHQGIDLANSAPNDTPSASIADTAAMMLAFTILRGGKAAQAYQGMNTPEGLVGSELNQQVEGAKINPAGVDAAARDALNPDNAQLREVPPEYTPPPPGVSPTVDAMLAMRPLASPVDIHGIAAAPDVDTAIKAADHLAGVTAPITAATLPKIPFEVAQATNGLAKAMDAFRSLADENGVIGHPVGPLRQAPLQRRPVPATAEDITLPNGVATKLLPNTARSAAAVSLDPFIESLGFQVKTVSSVGGTNEGMVFSTDGKTIYVTPGAKIDPYHLATHEITHTTDNALLASGEHGADLIKLANDTVAETLTPEAKAAYVLYYGHGANKGLVDEAMTNGTGSTRRVPLNFDLTDDQITKLAGIFDSNPNGVDYTTEMRADIHGEAMQSESYWRTFTDHLVGKYGTEYAKGVIGRLVDAFKAVVDTYRAHFGNDNHFLTNVLISNHEAAYQAIARVDAEYFSRRRSNPETTGEAKASPERDMANPDFKKWFGKSKAVDEKGLPQVWYHGTRQNFESFIPGKTHALFFTRAPEFATDFAGSANPSAHGNVIPAYLRAEKPFDYAKPAERARLIDEIMRNEQTYGEGSYQALETKGNLAYYTRAMLEDGLAHDKTNWAVMENPEVFRALKSLGYDSFYTLENGVKNLAVFDPHQVKSAIGNRGTFSLNDARITASPEREFPAFAQKANEKAFRAPEVRDESGRLLSPLGKPTELTEEQWHQTRSPAFKNWFGDWEAFAGKPSGVWSDAAGEVSKVVNQRTGEPLEVYHGTQKAGFDTFDTRMRYSSVAGSLFFTDARETARTYSGSTKDAEINVDEDGTFNEHRGIYKVFLNIRDPWEDHFEGANWDGSRWGQFSVVKGAGEDEEIQYTKAGKGYFDDEGEARALAKEVKGRVVSAQDHYESTDTVVKAAQRMGKDGAIIREVVDSGPQGDHYEPVDVFAVFSPEQIKSADKNVGTFDPNDARITASPEREISNPVHGTPEEKVEQLRKLSEENAPKVEAFTKKVDAAFGTKSGTSFKLPEAILSKAVRPSILAQKPWFGVEHVRDSYRFKTVLESYADLPKIVDMVHSDLGAEIVKADLGKVLRPLVWGWRIASFDLRMPNGQLVEYYLPVREQEAYKKIEGHKLFEGWRNRDLSKLSDEDLTQYQQALTKSNAGYETAWRKSLARTGQDEEAVRAFLAHAADSAGEAGRNSSFNSSAEKTLPFTQTPLTNEPNTLASESRTMTRSGGSTETDTTGSTGASNEKVTPDTVYASPDRNQVRMVKDYDAQGRYAGLKELTPAQQRALKEMGHILVDDGTRARKLEWATPTRVQGTRVDDSVIEKARILAPKLVKMARLGVSGKEWYEDTGREIMKVFRGDYDQAEKFVRIIAITSSNNEVQGNTTVALKAWAQFAAGKPIKGIGVGAKDRDIAGTLYFGKPWGGTKTNTFYINITDAMKGEDTGHSTQDMHMGNFAFGHRKLTALQYSILEEATRITAKKMGVIPRQLQAMVWVPQKVKHTLANWAERGIHADWTQKEREASALDSAVKSYADYLRLKGVTELPVNFVTKMTDAARQAATHNAYVEAVPSTDTATGAEAAALKDDDKTAFSKAIFAAASPVDVARRVLGRDDVEFRAPTSSGGFEDTVTPNKVLGMVSRTGQPISADEAARVAKALNYVYTQDGVPVARYDPALHDSPDATTQVLFTLPVNKKNEVTPAALRKFYTVLKEHFGPGIGFSREGEQQVIVGNYDGMAPDKFTDAARGAAQDAGLPPPEVTASEGYYAAHDWKDDPAGSRHEIWAEDGVSGQPDLQQRLADWRNAAVHAGQDWLEEHRADAAGGGQPGAVLAEQASPERDDLSKTIKKVGKSNALYSLLAESEAQSGPYDGGCLIAAKAIIRANGGGELVRVVSDANGGQTEHYGARIGGRIYDFDGGFATPEAWIKAFARHENIPDRKLSFATGHDAESEIPDDPVAEKRVAAMLAQAGVEQASPERGALDLTGVHYSNEPRDILDGRYYGTGTRGAEADRVFRSEDPRLKNRLYAYINQGQGITPEQGVGAHAHAVNFKNIYDAQLDREGLRAKAASIEDAGDRANAFESSVLDHGYDGYYARGDGQRQGAAVLLGDASKNFQPEKAAPEGQEAAGAPNILNQVDLSQTGKPPGISLTGIHFSNKARDTLDGRFYGTGVPGAEREHLAATSDSRLRDRLDFYVSTGQGVFPETGVGVVAHAVELTNLYDADVDPLNLFGGNSPAELAAAESGVIDAGYRGYLARTFGNRQGAAVVLGEASHALKPIATGTEAEIAPLATVAPAGNYSDAQRLAQSLMAQRRRLPAGQNDAAGWRRMLAAVVPDLFPRVEASGALDRLQGPVYLDQIARAIYRPVGLFQASPPKLGSFNPNNPDITASPDRTRVDQANAFESSVLDHGYDGYYARGDGQRQGAAVLLGDASKNFQPEKAAPEGQEAAGAPIASGPVLTPTEEALRDLNASKKLPAGEQSGADWARDILRLEPGIAEKMGPALAEVARGGRMYRSEVSLVARNALEQASPIRNGFFSPLERAIEQASDKVFTTGDQTKLWLDANKSKLGLKQDEVIWSGLDDYLALRGKERVGKQEVLDFLSGNGVRTSDVEKGSDGTPNTKFSGYWKSSYKGGIPGTYREILVTLPLTKEENLFGEREPSFKSPHWDEPNVLVHLRTDEVNGADGGRYLRVGEIQSDWGQKGKKEGFYTTPAGQLPPGYSIEKVAIANPLQGLGGNNQKRVDRYVVKTPDGRVATQHFNTAAGAIAAFEANARAGGQPPPAPFVTDTKSWVALGIKKAILQAVRNGDDGVVFGTGQQNADLYDLSKQIERIEYADMGDGTYHVLAVTPGHDTLLGDMYTAKQLEDLVGKDVAEKIVSGEGVEHRINEGYKVLSGLDLKVGGEGMRAFYDKIVPQVADDVLKKLGGGKAEPQQIQNGLSHVDPNTGDAIGDGKAYAPQPGFKITPEMRAKVQAEGLPQFSPDRTRVDQANAAQSALDKFTGALRPIIRSIGIHTLPMSTGSEDAMVMAKKYANAERLSQLQWKRFDDKLVEDFKPAQWARMWDAGDEENDIRAGRIPASPDKGLASLTPAERAPLELMHQYGEELWRRMQENGMVEGGSLPYWMPRQAVAIGLDGGYETISLTKGDGAGDTGRNISLRASSALHRKYATAAESEEAMQNIPVPEGYGVGIARNVRVMPMALARMERALAARELINQIKALGMLSGRDTVLNGAADKGDPDYFTLDHPAFKTWKPDYNDDGAVRKDENGDPVLIKVPMRISKDFEGPLRAVMTSKPGAVYSALMALKAKEMTVNMYSPAIHNAVEYGRAVPAMLTTDLPTAAKNAFTLGAYTYVVGNRAKNDPAQISFAVQHGLVPIGGRGPQQDIAGMMEDPSLQVGKSWTAKALAAPVSLISDRGATAVKKGVDAAGKFWHQTLLWDRVADLQMGLFTTMHASLVNKGMASEDAATVAAHFANLYAGAMPREAMADGARKLANITLWSRTFTLGNISAMKAAITGLPAEAQAIIRQNSGEAAAKVGNNIARKKAAAMVVLDIGLMYAATSALQDWLRKKPDETWGQIADRYVARYGKLADKLREDPLAVLSHPFGSLGSLMSTDMNETGKEARSFWKTDKNGTAIYIRMPFGKVGEEFENYLTFPAGTIKQLRAKESNFVRPIDQIANNDAGFGRKIYDDTKNASLLKNLGAIATELVKTQFPAQSIQAALDMTAGHGDEIDAYKVWGPLVGLTFSSGAKGGPLLGEMYAANSAHQDAVARVMPDIAHAVKMGDTATAVQLMQSVAFTPQQMQTTLMHLQNPATRMLEISKSGKAKINPELMRDYRTSDEEGRDKLANVNR